ncbi:MAG: hypothetical protein BGO90_02940 [Legionella sp. 40-6]|nr:hypothetical protein [Legionella sp.]OJY08830.1 MAG: hypothetical protein BGO90_02940 [Legionella sp. 40-6]
MELQQIEDAIKGDLATLSTLKMGYVSAKDLYGRVLWLAFKLSFVLLAINTCVRLVLMGTGLYPITFTVSLMIGSWMACFMATFVLGMVLSRFIIISKLIKGRLKTEGLMKKIFRHLGWVFLGIYSVSYALITLVVVAGMDDHMNDLDVLAFITIFSQIISFIVAVGITGLLAGVELDRLGLGAVFNVLSEIITKARKSHQNTHSSKDA